MNVIRQITDEIEGVKGVKLLDVDPGEAVSYTHLEIWGVKLGKKFMMDIRHMKPFDTIGKYAGPVLIIHGSDDKVVPVDYAKRALKTYRNATLKVIDKAGHGFNPAERKLSNKYVGEFLAK